MYFLEFFMLEIYQIYGIYDDLVVVIWEFI